MALGANRSVIRGMVLRSVARMTPVGGVIGPACASGRLVRAQLYGMTSFDPTVIARVALLPSTPSAPGLCRRKGVGGPDAGTRYE
jgi:hypothetical protein